MKFNLQHSKKLTSIEQVADDSLETLLKLFSFLLPENSYSIIKLKLRSWNFEKECMVSYKKVAINVIAQTIWAASVYKNI